MTTLIPQFDLKNGGATPTGAVNRPINEKLAETVSVKDFGADSTGATDSTTAIQNAVNSGAGMVHFPKGTYVISTPIQLPAGIIVYGDSAGQVSSIGTTITNSQVGGGCFWMTSSTSPAQVDGATITNFNLNADYPIMLNSPTVTISDGGASPYYMKPKIDNCYIMPRVNGTGTGISFSKCFDFQIVRCLIRNFDIGILLQGSDIGWVQNNRIISSVTYQILEISTGTFGSQTEIRNNDILVGGTGCTYIKSCGLHPRIYDNYLEATSAIVGFIDLTNISCPQYGSNVPNYPYTIVCRDNRLDGHSLVSSFVYRLDGTVPTTNTVLHDAGTSGTAGTGLTVNGNFLPILYNFNRIATYDIKVPVGNAKYTNFQTGQMPQVFKGLTISPEALSNCQDLNANNAGFYVGYDGSEAIVVYPTMTGANSPLYIYLPPYGSTTNPLNSGTTYTVYITARSPSSETLNVGVLNNGTGGILVPLSLTPSYQTFSIGSVSAPVSSNLFGVYMTRATTTANIFIQSITFQSA
jgi:hypothetical protein